MYILWKRYNTKINYSIPSIQSPFEIVSSKKSAEEEESIEKEAEETASSWFSGNSRLPNLSYFVTSVMVTSHSQKSCPLRLHPNCNDQKVEMIVKCSLLDFLSSVMTCYFSKQIPGTLVPFRTGSTTLR